MDWYGGCFAKGAEPAASGNNANSFQLFCACSLDFVFLHLECNASDDVLQWADGVLQKHAKRRAFVTKHMGLSPLKRPDTTRDFFTAPKGRMQWKKCHGDHGNSPQQMWERCFRKHDNLVAVFSGDESRTQAMRLASRNEHGKAVYELMSDYGGSWLRLNRFVPKEDQIQVRTVDSGINTLCDSTKAVADPKEHQFTLNYDMTKR